MEQMGNITMAERVKAVEVKLGEHCKTQLIADKKNDDAHDRIEAKVDQLPEKVAELIKPKADKEEVEEVKKDVSNWDTRIWTAIITAFVGLLLALANFILRQ